MCRSETEEERAAWTSRTQELSGELKSAADKLSQSLKSKKKVAIKVKVFYSILTCLYAHRLLDTTRVQLKSFIVH